MEMELILLLTICLLMFSGKTFGNETGHVKIIIKEDEDVILPCSLKTIHEDDETIFDWKKDGKDVLLYESGTVNPSTQHDQFRGRVSHFRNGAKSENASIKIIKTKVTDSGHYTCFDIIQSPPEKRNQVVLTVGAVAKPSVSRLNENDDWALLRCEITGASPKPTVVWYDSDGNKVSDKEPQVIEQGDHYDVILETTVTKTDKYTCVATQEGLHHQFNKTTSVYIAGEENGATNGNGWITFAKYFGIVFGCFIGGSILLVVWKYLQTFHPRGNPKYSAGQDDTTNSPSAPLQNGVQNNSSGLQNDPTGVI
ncbi:butyrophilin-like protein 2 isoform X2 [Fundulus heteroclitus]|uniref:butyrophilin-like protein 2 isoform X2 n=1 Tax=Fundulus heteroclitus TaxID=8078 RepID=UPI00165C36C5|nr:butyrophilin-like protein 2 isoform X2 [Fundulus heteroclitus]